MIKTLMIDGQPVTFKSTALTPIVYKSQFNSDFLVDVVKLMPMITSFYKSFKGLNVTDSEDMDMKLDELDLGGLDAFDTTVFTNFIWAFAKTADKDIPDPVEWFYSFDEFPIMDYLPDIVELMVASFSSSKSAKSLKKKNYLTATQSH